MIPTIPKNILGDRLAGRGRGRGTGRGRGINREPVDPDKIIQGTDGDALGSRISAVNAGYLTDPYIVHFYTGQERPTRYPIINRGTYARTTAIDRLVTSFLNSSPDQTLQIVSLGAGKDTRYFRLASEFKPRRFIYHEIDYRTITQEKIQIIKRTPELLSVITDHSGEADNIRTNDDGQLISPSYNLHPIDLRDIEPSKLPEMPNLRPDVPTLILSECCLCYISYAHQAQILASFTQHYIPAPTPIALIIYEPIRPNDSFGRVMISNLNSRGITMQTIQKFEDLTAQRGRLREAGFSDSQNAADINFIYEKWVDKGEQQRVARCEMLDEIEEWVMLAQHYCVAWGARDPGNAVFGSAWKDFPMQQDG